MDWGTEKKVIAFGTIEKDGPEEKEAFLLCPKILGEVFKAGTKLCTRFLWF